MAWYHHKFYGGGERSKNKYTLVLIKAGMRKSLPYAILLKVKTVNVYNYIVRWGVT
jgi:hypothetical protein